MTNLYSFIPGSLKRPLSELFLTDASLWNQWNQYKFIAFNPIQTPTISFSPVNSTNVGFSPQNFLTFSFNPFATLV